MNASDLQSLENALSKLGRGFGYPPTPQIAPRVMARLKQPAARRLRPGRWAWVLAAILLISLLMLVPPARAAILNIIQIGVVRIFRGPAAPPAPNPAPTSIGAPPVQMPLTATPAPIRVPSLLNLAGETTLPAAQAKLGFPILLPTYPPDLGPPDKVYLQDLGGPMLVLVWLERGSSDQVRMSLHEITPDSWAIKKFNPPVIQDVTVNGQPGIWTEGPYMLQVGYQDYVMVRLVAGHVLIWTQDDITYRLETDLSLEEAIKIAESLKPVR